ncbi:hypothetical protein [Aquimonas voraii]|uniref:hypothetical protein n=1 Tax=Aquimonas voraii TaxID=265719 RepID=UPI00115FF28F|nr:hypothetical protein [Aquimonas voraii]
MLVLMGCWAGTALAQQTFHVATTGSDQPGGGSQAQPWRTITYALDRVPDGSLILVDPGTYTGRVRIRGNFAQGVTVRSRLPYQARLRASEAVLTIYNDAADIAGITIEGFDIAHSGAGASALVVHVQDGGSTDTRRITLRDNILRDSWNNDILKINNGASGIRVIGNLFYNQQGSDEHIDINSVDDVLVEGNVFFNDFAASGRTNANDTAAYIVVKDSNGNDDEYLGARNVIVRRNIFLNWQGSSGSNFLLFGEDGHPYHEAFDCVAENNLFIGNAGNAIRAAFGVKGSRDIVFRANTVVGDLPGNAFAMRLNREGSNPTVQNIRFFNNLWADPTGSMADFSDVLSADVSGIVLRRNGYFNGGSTIPQDAGDAVNVSNDGEARIGDPRLPTQAGIVTPHWLQAQSRFNGGFERIADVFGYYALTYGQPAAGGGGIDQADPAQMPGDDLLGRTRGASPDLGAVERVEVAPVLFANGFEP